MPKWIELHGVKSDRTFQMRDDAVVCIVPPCDEDRKTPDGVLIHKGASVVYVGHASFQVTETPDEIKSKIEWAAVE